MDETAVRMKFMDYLPTLTEKQTDLFMAVLRNDCEHVKQVFQTFSELKEDKEWFDYWILSTALKYGHVKIIEFLIEKDCRLRVPEKTLIYYTPLYYACKMWDPLLAEKLIKKGASIHDKDANKITPIELIVQHMNTSMIDMILCCYNDGLVRDATWQDLDIFHLACWRGYLNIVEKFINKGINLNSRSVFKSKKWKGFSPLHFTVDGDRTEVFHFLLKHNADMFATDRRGDTPLHLAFAQGKHEQFFGSDIIGELSRVLRTNFQNPANEEGLTLFHILCQTYVSQSNYQHLNVIRYFINNKIDVNEQVSMERSVDPGYTALHIAASISSLELLRILLESGADPKKVDKLGRTPLHVVCRKFDPNSCFKFPNYKKEHETIVKLLLLHGAEVGIADTAGNETPLHSAFYNEPVNNSIVDLLLSVKHLGNNYTDCQGLSYFHIACSRSNPSTVRALVSTGASVNSRINLHASYFTDWSALHFAVYFNQKEIVKYLLVNGADVNAKVSHTKMTPLHFACEHRYTRFFQFCHLSDRNSNNCDPFNVNWESSRQDQYNIIESLLRCGASVNDKDCTGHTPLLLACRIPIDLIMKNYQGPNIAHDYYRSNVLKEIHIRQEYIVDILLRHGAEIRAKNLPILHAIINDIKDDETFEIGEKLMSKLLDEGADVNSTLFPKATTPLHLAVEKCSDECALKVIDVLLSEPSINVDAQNSSGETSLHVAVRRHKQALVEKLLDAGADINMENINGLSTIELLLNVPPQVRRERPCRLVSGRMVFHVKKLVALNSFIKKEIRQWFDTLPQHITDWAKPTFERIDAEIEVLKSKKVDTYTSLYDILRKNVNDMSKHVRNDDFELLVRSLSLPTDFPTFHKMLELQSRNGIIRDSMLETAKTVLSSITKVDWPEPCSDNIFKYLSNRDFETLVEFDLNSKHPKRKAEQCLDPCENITPKVSRHI